MHANAALSLTQNRQSPAEIPVKKPAHLRTLVKYGMSISQVAELYGVPVKTIRAVLHKA